jgi:hypothetical protein
MRKPPRADGQPRSFDGAEKEIQRDKEDKTKERQSKEKERERILKRIRAALFPHIEGESPLEVMIRVMHDPSVPIDRRPYMVKAVAPYIRAALTSEEWATLTDFGHEMDASPVNEKPLQRGNKTHA